MKCIAHFLKPYFIACCNKNNYSDIKKIYIYFNIIVIFAFSVSAEPMSM